MDNNTTMHTTHQNLSTSRLIQSLILLVTCIIIADAFIANTPTSSKQLIHRYPPVKNTIPSNENTHLYTTHKHKIRMSSQTDQPEWDPETQIYKDGIVPAHHSMSMTMEELLSVNQGKLKIFGYGSLCWHPGSEGVLSLASIEEDEHDHDESDDATHPNTTTARPKRKVTTDPGRAIGYQRCWAQRSADHRGTPQFNGIVCTLLSDEEVWKLHHGDDKDVNNDESIDDVTNAEKNTMQSISNMRPSMTEGLIYTVDAELVEDCLAELDFREKGVCIIKQGNV